jgi:hypothetical protein
MTHNFYSASVNPGVLSRASPKQRPTRAIEFPLGPV